MKFLRQPKVDEQVAAHVPTPQLGILLVQLGTPDDATVPSVRRYLKQFLSDRHVIELCPFLWSLLLHGIILRTRPPKSAALYERLFSTYGPVLQTYSKSLTQKLQNLWPEQNARPKVRYAMRYGQPSCARALQQLLVEDGCDRILVVPLFPQYSNSTTGSVVDHLHDELQKFRVKPHWRIINEFATHPTYLDIQAQKIADALQQRAQAPQRIILSYHGIPQRYEDRGDAYGPYCHHTTQEIAKRLNYPREHILHTYQSRFGKEPWLQPYTDETLIQLAKDGVTDVMIASPAFTMDCLETIDELGVESRHAFHEAGGLHYHLVSCLNDDDAWVKGLHTIIQDNLGGWLPKI